MVVGIRLPFQDFGTYRHEEVIQSLVAHSKDLCTTVMQRRLQVEKERALGPRYLLKHGDQDLEVVAALRQVERQGVNSSFEVGRPLQRRPRKMIVPIPSSGWI